MPSEAYCLFYAEDDLINQKCSFLTIKKESFRKLSNFNFQWAKTLYQKSFNHITFIFTLFEGYNCNKLYEIQ